jgi:UPF0755 protein
MDEKEKTIEARKSSMTKSFATFFIVCIALCVLTMYWLYQPPHGEYPRFVTIEEGSSAATIAHVVKDAGVVRSQIILYTLLTYSNDPTKIYAGTYVFDEPLNIGEVAQKLAGGDILTPTITLTIPEGTANKDVARIAERVLEAFDTELFLELSSSDEGYLLPETYHLPPTFTEAELHTLLKKSFEDTTKVLDFSKSALSKEGVVILASVLEREANDETSMRMVSGILQNRLSIDMPLQADATLEYVLDKPLKDLTPDDLKRNSPYNSYLNKGLPPTPIGNPGIMALESVLAPTKSDFLFYITGNDGNFYYAKTYAEHKRNIDSYLR